MAQQTTPQPSATLRLWDGPAPHAPEHPGPETFDAEGRVKNVSVPTLSLYLPPKEKANGMAVIVCSGGGYAQLAVEKHGNGTAAALVPQGVAVIALKYRLKPPSTDVRRDALLDAERTVRLVRHHAAEWNIDPHRIGIVGHSAGANLVLNLMVHADDGNPTSADPIERESSRPNFAGLMSTWSGGQTLEDLKFPVDAPPAFFCHARDDETALLDFAEGVAGQLRGLGVPVKTTYHETGGHQAFTIGQGLHGDWAPQFLAWAQDILRPRTVVVFGDSITAGNNEALEDKTRLWVTQLERRTHGQLQMLNRGRGGRPTDSLDEFGQVLEVQPAADMLVIALGGNDARDITDACVPKAVKNVTEMISLARAKYGAKLPILLAGPANVYKDALGPTKPIGDQRQQKVKELGEAFAALAKEQGCSFISWNGVVAPENLTHDGVHPDEAGNDAIAAVMLPSVRKTIWGG
jgi:acetyl esterase/lipase